MKFGVNLINFGPGVSPDSLLRWTQFAEAVGYLLVMISDHVAVTADVNEIYPAPFYDPFIALSWLAGATSTVKLGTTVIIIPYRNPLLVARMSANLDQVSGGRFILGVGAGWAAQEFEALGVPFHHRGAMTDDYLAAIKTLWTNDVASYHGRFVSFDDVRNGPRPAQTPHPPIWVGGHSDAALRRAVRFGDAWHPIGFRIDWMRDTALPRLRDIAESEGRPVPVLCPRIKIALSTSTIEDAGRLAGEGTLAQVRGDLEALESMGADFVLLDTYLDEPEATRSHEGSWRTLATLAEEVIDLGREKLR